MREKTHAADVLAGVAERLKALSHRIHAHPEIAFEETRAASWVGEELERGGFTVDLGAYELPTALMATRGSGPLHVAFCAEYDALPGLGHACGHNLIAAAAVGAAIALAPVADDLGLKVSVMGTPAEEVNDGGGKILLLQRGAFDTVHAAMMVHPAPLDVALPRIIAASMFDVVYEGRPAHASLFPQLGVNAADAMTLAQVAIGLLRQHIWPADRIHGIVTDGGTAPNVIPDRTSGRFVLRSSSLKSLDALRAKVRRCFEAGAHATGARLHVLGGDLPYAEMRHDPDLAALYRQNAGQLGRSFPELGAWRDRIAASTDLGNVSHVLPCIHPMIGIGSLPAMNHQPEFAAHCVTAAADQALLDGATALAWTAIDAATTDGLRRRLLGRTGGPGSGLEA